MAGDQTVIGAGVRTAIGAMNGALATVPAAQRGATCIKALPERTGVPGNRIDEVIRGHVVQAGQAITVQGKTTKVETAEGPSRFDEAKLRALKPAFGPEGTIPARNASSIHGGAAALLVGPASLCCERGLTPQVRIIATTTRSQEPQWFTTAPIGALNKQMQELKLNWSVADVDRLEINEAFGTVTMVAEHELKLPAGKVNNDGGAVTLGHPSGCSGTRLLVPLLNGLRQTGGRHGLASLGIGSGEAVAMAVETLQ